MNPADVWRYVGQRIGFFTKETSALIPEGPGCYAWFLPLWIYTQNLSVLLQLVERILLYDPETGSLSEKRIPLTLNWDVLSLEVRRLAAAEPSAHLQEQWSRVMSTPETRAVFERSLMEASIFMPPLYVGKADSLRDRYLQHVEGRGTGLNTFHRRFTEFARREDISLSLSDLLFVCVETPVEENRLLRELGMNELLEQLLMQLCRPPFSIR
jgi:hypothetical protein